MAGALVGAAILAAWFGEYWPATGWTVLPRAQLVAKGRQLAAQFGLNVSDWKPYAIASVRKSLRRYGNGVSPLSLRVTYVAKQGGRAAEVGFDSAGVPDYWRAPHGFKPPGQRLSEASAATAAFQIMAAAQAASYQGPVRSMGDDVEEEDYLWKKPTPAHTDLRNEIKVVTRDSVVTSVERKVYLSTGDEEDSQAGDTQDYWDVLGGIFGLMCTVGFIAILSIYVLWLARKAVSHQFPMRVAGAALFVMSVAMLWGAAWENMHSLSPHESLPVVNILFIALVLLGFVAVARGISANARPKWMTLEQLCLLAPLSKATGQSIGAGLLVSPLLVAVPFLLAGCGLFPHSWVRPNNVELLYSRAPLLDSLSIQTDVYLIGFFGFALPVLERLIRLRWLRWFLVVPLGTLFFADQTRVVAGPLAAALAAGLLTFILYWFVWANFDLLAMVTLQLASGLLLSFLLLAQKGGTIWSLVAALAGLTVVAYWFYRRGQTVVEGDPLASIPAVAGFRAEREKLRAEFSLARRAQQDMLPPTPDIPGYSLAASCTPSLEVGGDLYDFLRLPDGRIGIGVADVSGKGVPAALYMTLTKGLLASVTKDSAQLVPVVEEVNRHLHGVTRKKVFVTMALGFLDVEKRVLECVRAGHNPVVWRQAAKDLTTLVAPGGLGLGITASRVFSTQLKIAEMALSEGDAVVFYSDGITEAMNSGLELFGEQRLLSAVAKTDSLDAADTRDSILADVSEFLNGVHPQDDMTLVVLRVGNGTSIEKLAQNGRGLCAMEGLPLRG